MRNINSRIGMPVNRDIIGEMFKPFTDINIFPEMKADLEEKETEYLLTVDLPGFTKSEISVEMKDDILEIQAEKEVNEEECEKRFILQERKYASACRKFKIVNIKEEEIKASFDNGVLTLVLPKKPIEEPKKNTIPID